MKFLRRFKLAQRKFRMNRERRDAIDEEPSLCATCNETDSRAKISCDHCFCQYHYECVHIDQRLLGQSSWTCDACVSNAANQSASNFGTPMKTSVSQPLQMQDFFKSYASNKPASEVPPPEQSPTRSRAKMPEEIAAEREEAYEAKVHQLLTENRRMRINIEELSAALSAKTRFRSKANSDSDEDVFESEIGKDDEEDKPKSESTEEITKRVLESLMTSLPAMIEKVVHPKTEQRKTVKRTANQRPVDPLEDSRQVVDFNRFAATMQRKHLDKLPTFGGEVKEWAYFECVFNQSTIDGAFSESDNVRRLREAIKAPARDLVMDLLMLSTEASAIMKILKKTYGDPSKLNEKLMDELVKFPNLKSETDSKLRQFMVNVKNYVANLKAIRKTNELNCDYTLKKLTEKLPFLYLREWNRVKLQNPEANIETFARFLSKKVDEIPINWTETHETSKSSSSTTPATKSKRVNAHQKAQAQPNCQGRSKEANEGKCFKCKGEHPLARCEDFKKLSADEKLKFVFSQYICISCLSSKDHRVKDCPTRRECKIDGCLKPHHRSLHYANPSVTRSQATTSNSSRYGKDGEQHQVNSNSLRIEAAPYNPGNQNSSTAASSSEPQASSSRAHPAMVHQMSHASDSAVLFKIVPIRVYGDNNVVVETFAFLDDGSSLTLIDKNLFNKLSLVGEPELLHLQWTKGITREEESTRAMITVSGSKKKETHTLTNVYTVENLDLPSQSVKADDLKSRYRHLRGLPLEDLNNAKPEILIGLQHAKFLLGEKTFAGNETDPIAAKTRLGWTVYGNATPSLNYVALTGTRRSGVQLSMHQQSRCDEELHHLVKSYFTTESFGVTPSQVDLTSEDDQRALEVMNRSMKLVNGRYEIGLLWKHDNIALPNSHPMAMRRLATLEKSLKKEEKLLRWMSEHVKDLVAKGYARKATTEDLSAAWPRIWYCPTFIVYNENKLPPKPRVVTDVAAYVESQSLNSNLLKGPDNMAPLLGGLFRFRENRIAVNADVREMFHQIRIIKDDQQCQRFLWRDGDESKAPTIYVMQSMMFGPTCSPACAQFVKNSHAKLFEKQFPQAVSAIVNNTYVDDYFNSHNTLEEALQISTQSIEIFSSMSFELVGFQSNSKALLEKLPKEKLKNAIVSLDQEESTSLVTKVLGMFWDSTLDFFTFKLSRNELMNSMLQPDFVPTKREILKTLMKIFDPLGLIAHYIIRGKVIQQEVWREGVGWDEKIPNHLSELWQEFVSQLPNIEKLKIPRWYAIGDPKKSQIQLVIFVDASEQAFAATAFFRFTTIEEIHVAHVMAKARVAPIKRLTIPQLELQAAVLGVRLAVTIKRLHSYEISETIYLSDSKVVLAWICTRKFNFKPFVAARIGEILESSTRREWNHVRSKDNIADDATKWFDPEMGDGNTRWFRGHAFMLLPQKQWPITPATDHATDRNENEQTSILHVITAKPNHLHMLLHPDTFDAITARFRSRWTSLTRVVAYMLRVNDFFAKRQKPRVIFITPEEVERAKLEIIKLIQLVAFPEEVKSFTKGKTSLDFLSKLNNFSPYMINGIIRMSTRSQKARISYAARNPAILPNKHPFVDLIIQHIHEKNFHMGTEMTIADVKEFAWIIDTRAAVNRVIRKCQLCKILRAKPQMQQMGQLPLPRLDFGVEPFTYVGLDAFGPYKVKYGRGSVKRWGLIFTCLTYRVVHIEILNDMSTEHCIMAINRFLSRRGQSLYFYSDNGSNFVGAKNRLHKDMIEIEAELGKEIAKRFHIEWHFIPAYSPWWGGAWERLIQAIKKCVDFVLTEEIPREDIFANAIIEAESWMNRRPLTHIPIDHEDAPPLTPNSALFAQGRDRTLVPREVPQRDAFSTRVTRRVDHLVNKFLSRWTREYLPEINRRSKWFDVKEPVKIDDIVILTEPNEPRNAWNRGKVIKVYPGEDGVVRAADVRLADGSIKKNRSAGRLAVLDVKVSSP